MTSKKQRLSAGLALGAAAGLAGAYAAVRALAKNSAGGDGADGPRVVIVGGGFAGLYAAKALGGAPARVTLIDKNNFHLFQPMLYQVATGNCPPTTSPRRCAPSSRTRRTPRC